MNTEQIITLGTKLGLPFNRPDNYADALKKGRVVFNGCNGQRFLFESKWPDPKIYKQIGKALVLYGMRLKSVEIHNVISITRDSLEEDL